MTGRRRWSATRKRGAPSRPAERAPRPAPHRRRRRRGGQDPGTARPAASGRKFEPILSIFLFDGDRLICERVISIRPPCSDSSASPATRSASRAAPDPGRPPLTIRRGLIGASPAPSLRAGLPASRAAATGASPEHAAARLLLGAVVHLMLGEEDRLDRRPQRGRARLAAVDLSGIGILSGSSRRPPPS
jgi:hypothetical protein